MATAHRLSFHPLARQARAALKWLQRTMGFEVSDLLVDSGDHLMDAQMIPGQRTVMIGSAWADWTASPLSLSGKNSQGSASRSTAGSMSTASRHAARGRRSSRSQPSWSTAFAPAGGGPGGAPLAPSGRRSYEEEMEQATGFNHVSS